MTNKHQQLKQAIIKAQPNRKTWLWNNGKILTLADVLVALSKRKRDYEIAVTPNMDLGDFLEIESQSEDLETKFIYKASGISWNLQKNYDDQSDELKDFLADLLIK